MGKEIKIDLRDRSPEDLEMIAGLATHVVTQIANEPLSDEVEREDVEESFLGADYSEAIEMSYDNIICLARNVLKNISAESWKDKQDPTNA